MHAIRAAAALLFSAAVAAAEQPSAPPSDGLITRLPRSWCGVFRWRGDHQDQHYTIAFTSVTRRADGRIEATGPGRNRTIVRRPALPAPVDITVIALIDPATRNVEIWERLASPAPNYRTEEPFVGTLDEDLQSMRLISRWRRDRRLLGDMVLHARPARAATEEPCGVPSS